jgi:hypothetical protein
MQGAQRNTLVPRLRLREVLSLPLSSENSNHSKYQLRVGPFLAAAVRVMGVVVAVDHTNYIVTIDDSSAVVPIHGSSLESRSFIPYKIGQLLEVVGEVCHQESRAIVAHSIYIREDPMHEMSFQLEIISCSRECYFSEYFRPKPDTTKPPDDGKRVVCLKFLTTHKTQNKIKQKKRAQRMWKTIFELEAVLPFAISKNGFKALEA